MKKRANPRLVGLFVLGGLGLFIAAVILYGMRDLFVQKDTYVSFFRGSVRGLDVGAPVSFRGIDIGQVKEIYGLVTSDSMDVEIAVIYEIDALKIRDPGGYTVREEDLDFRQRAQNLVEYGLRAKLETASLLTGQRYVDFDLFPNDEPRMTGIDVGYPEIPTVASEFEEIQRNLRETMRAIAKLPLNEVIVDIQGGVQSLQDFLSSADMSETSANLARATESLNTLVHHLDGRSEQVTAKIVDTAESAQAAMSQLREVLKKIDQTTASSHEVGYQIGEVLDEVSDAARAIRLLAEYLEQHPEALVTGKGDGK